MFFRQKYLNVNITASPFLSFSAFGLQEWGKSIYFANMKKDELKQEVERVVGHELREARDFELLSQLIFKGTREQLSPTTLKRLWGYLKNEEVQTRQHTLDVLARFAGYRSYEDFCTHPDNKEDVQSGICIEERVSTEKMRLGQRLIITWLPDRRIVVRHLGGSRFEILEAENSKLSVGDTFRCHLMIQHEPLYLDELNHQGLPPTAYVAGQRDGVMIQVCD